MDNRETIEIEVLKIFTEKQKFDNKYNSMMASFLTKAYELVGLSDDLYQVEHTTRLNKLSLKDYILNSEICAILKERNISGYSTEELKNYMNKFESQHMLSVYPYRLALALYEELEIIEETEKARINYEVNELSKILDKVSNITTLNKEKYQDLYNSILLQLKEQYLDNNLMDDTINNYIVQILNDIFTYYLYGNKEIPISNEDDTTTNDNV